MADLFRLILLILLLPIILILIGPFLIVAAFRGRQPLGPITLDTSRYRLAGRGGAFILGMVLWVLVWGGLAWLALNAFPSLNTVALTPLFPTASVTLPDEVTPTPQLNSPTPGGVATSIPLVETVTSDPGPTPTPLPPTFTPVPPSPTFTPTPTWTLSPTATPFSTQISVTATSTQEPVTVQNESGTPAVPTPSPQGTLTFSERQAVITTVEEANSLLREAMTLANEENLERMETVWQGLALRVARNFATELYDKYAKPIQVRFEYLKPPTIDPASKEDEVIVTSREQWTYGGPTKFDREEAFEFIYTLEKVEGQWVITRYTYRNLPTPTPGPTSASTESP